MMNIITTIVRRYLTMMATLIQLNQRIFATEFAEITEMNYDQELNEEDTTVFSEYFLRDDIRETFPNQLNTLYPILTGTNLKS